MDANEYELTEDVKVFYVAAETFPQGITDAFDKLEEAVGSLMDHHVYGITECTGDKLIYMAGIEVQNKAYDLPVYTIPKGIYLYYTLSNWRKNIAQIPELFAKFDNRPEIKKQTICLEDYVSETEMRAMAQKA